jgi:hypothetical protein
MSLMSEELAYKEHLHALKKYKKKYGGKDDKKKKGQKDKSKESETAASAAAGPPPPPPTLSRPEPTSAFSALVDYFPVDPREGATRHFYRVIELGRYIQLFVLDLREGDMGKAQAKWLKDQLEGSGHAWKIVLCGVPLGFIEHVSTPLKSQKSSEDKQSTAYEPSLVIATAEDDSQVEKSGDQPATSGVKIDERDGSSSSIQSVFRDIAQSFLYAELDDDADRSLDVDIADSADNFSKISIGGNVELNVVNIAEPIPISSSTDHNDLLVR